MKDYEQDCEVPQYFAIEENELIQVLLSRIKKILDAKYEPADLHQVVNDCIHLSSKEKYNYIYCLLMINIYSMVYWANGNVKIMIFN